MMKCAVGIAGLFCIIGNGAVQAQTADYRVIEPTRLYVAYSKTSNIIFPFAISSVDRGSRDLMVQKAKGVKNILQVKAGKENFSETNLSIVTEDGKFYSFLVGYDSKPSILNLQFSKYSQGTDDEPARLTRDTLNAADVERTADLVKISKTKRRGPHDKKFEIEAKLTSVYIKNDLFYFQVFLENKSSINYYIDQLKLSVRDRKVARRTASQEIDVVPRYITGNSTVVKARDKGGLVLAVPKFTIPDKKQLFLFLSEEDGGRNLKLKIKNRHLVNAIPITN
ncbi:conjugative transposon protein TraN [Chitinophaga defluvii]|uniref:Conjugative transposon protein TraN n=1 Tax=Chitinophaga defluvii TaxID=3163343 RepID=A0ABV2T4B0_9BACT